MTRLAALAASATVLAAAAPAEIAGPAVVIDGDSIAINGQIIRLHGIDAPQTKQTCRINGVPWACGVAAWGALVQLTAGMQLDCVRKAEYRGQNMVAVCFAGKLDINGLMVADGWALADRRRSSDYADAEAVARAAKHGLWRGTFVRPREWRRGKRLASATAGNELPGGCTIKGNINPMGEPIYHLSGGRWYDAITINEVKGERWFCTESAARAAGWSRSPQ